MCRKTTFLPDECIKCLQNICIHPAAILASASWKVLLYFYVVQYCLYCSHQSLSVSIHLYISLNGITVFLMFLITSWSQIVLLDYNWGRSTKFWTLYIGILYGPLPAFMAIHSSIFLSPHYMRALYSQSHAICLHIEHACRSSSRESVIEVEKALLSLKLVLRNFKKFKFPNPSGVYRMKTKLNKYQEHFFSAQG